MIEKVVVAPQSDRTLLVELHGDIARLITATAGGYRCHQNKTPCLNEGGAFCAVGGCGGPIPAFPKSSPMGQREPCSLSIRRFKSGACNHLKLLFEAAA